MTKTASILSFFKKNEGFTLREISNKTGIKYNTVRSSVRRLRLRGELKRVSYGNYRYTGRTKQTTFTRRQRTIQKQKFRKKIVKNTIYCTSLSASRHSAVNVFAVTLESNRTDRSTELIQAIENHRQFKRCYFRAFEFGYADDFASSRDIMHLPEYPVIEVGEE